MEPPLQRLPREFRRPREELRMLVVMAPQLDGPRDTSVAIIEEALGRGLRVDVCDNDDLQFEPDGAAAEAACVLTAGIEGMELTPPSRTLLTRYNVILYRKVPFTIEALHATLLLEHARETALMVNDPRGMREANDKLFALRFPSFTPATAVLHNPAAIRAFCNAQNGECVIKPIDGFAGSGIFLLRDGDPNISAIIDMATQDGSRRVIAQAALPVAECGDKRIFLLDGEPIGALLRRPAAGEFRANMHRAGSPCDHAHLARGCHRSRGWRFVPRAWARFSRDRRHCRAPDRDQRDRRSRLSRDRGSHGATPAGMLSRLPATRALIAGVAAALLRCRLAAWLVQFLRQQERPSPKRKRPFC
jgi:glutathione synthase